jgi:RNA polymerase subunit RPABC4/transcription elongation factor Spt4
MLSGILGYIYMAICLQVIAKKTNTTNDWMAWIPIANIFLMINIARKPLWWFILLLIPVVNIVIGIILWMAIAERRGKENWIGILLIVPVIGVFVPGYLAFFDYKKEAKPEITPPYVSTGTEAANKPTVGYKHLCKYCEKLIPPDSVACPYCEKVNPLGPFRCPKCHEPIEKDWKVCPKCNLGLRILCPYCGKITFFGDHCEDCGKRLLVTCPNCGQEQPPISDNCMKCGKALKPKNISN